jgi:hypothetical protein
VCFFAFSPPLLGVCYTTLRLSFNAATDILADAFNMSSSEKDFEKGDDHVITTVAPDNKELAERNPDSWILTRFGGRDTWYGRLFAKLFDLGVEARGVEWVREEDRQSKPGWVWSNLLMWFSVRYNARRCIFCRY